MAVMGKYCKAYYLKQLRAFSGWEEQRENARRVKNDEEGKDTDTPRDLTDQDFLYLQETYTVTDGIFLDQNIIFDRVTPEWIEYCKTQLRFEVPSYETVKQENTTV